MLHREHDKDDFLANSIISKKRLQRILEWTGFPEISFENGSVNNKDVLTTTSITLRMATVAMLDIKIESCDLLLVSGNDLEASSLRELRYSLVLSGGSNRDLPLKNPRIMPIAFNHKGWRAPCYYFRIKSYLTTASKHPVSFLPIPALIQTNLPSASFILYMATNQ